MATQDTDVKRSPDLRPLLGDHPPQLPTAWGEQIVLQMTDAQFAELKAFITQLILSTREPIAPAQ